MYDVSDHSFIGYKKWKVIYILLLADLSHCFQYFVFNIFGDKFVS